MLQFFVLDDCYLDDMASVQHEFWEKVPEIRMLVTEGNCAYTYDSHTSRIFRDSQTKGLDSGGDSEVTDVREPGSSRV